MAFFAPLVLGGAQGAAGLFSSLLGNRGARSAAEANMRSVLLRAGDDKRQRSLQYQRDKDTVVNTVAASGQTGQAFTALLASLAGDAAEDTFIIDRNAKAEVESIRAGASAAMTSPALAFGGQALAGFASGVQLSQLAGEAGGWSKLLTFGSGSEVPYYLSRPGG